MFVFYQIGTFSFRRTKSTRTFCKNLYLYVTTYTITCTNLTSIAESKCTFSQKRTGAMSKSPCNCQIRTRTHLFVSHELLQYQTVSRFPKMWGYKNLYLRLHINIIRHECLVNVRLIWRPTGIFDDTFESLSRFDGREVAVGLWTLRSRRRWADKKGRDARCRSVHLRNDGSLYTAAWHGAPCSSAWTRRSYLSRTYIFQHALFFGENFTNFLHQNLRL